MKSVLARLPTRAFLQWMEDLGMSSYCCLLPSQTLACDHFHEKTMTYVDSHAEKGTTGGFSRTSDTICRVSCKRKMRAFYTKIKTVKIVAAALTTQVWSLLIMEPRVTECVHHMLITEGNPAARIVRLTCCTVSCLEGI